MHPYTSAADATSAYLCFVRAFVRWMQPPEALSGLRALLHLAGLLISVLSHLQRLESNLNLILASKLE